MRQNRPYQQKDKRPSASKRGRPAGYGAPSASMMRLAQQAAMRARELKGLDTELSTGPVLATTTTNGNAFVLNLIRPGTGSMNRIGRKIKCKSLRLKGLLTYQYTPEATTLDRNGNVLRMVVVWDKQPSGVLPAFDAIFGQTAQDGSETSEFMDSLRYDNTDRFRVLRDVVVTGSPQLDASGGTVNETDVQFPFDEFIKLRGCETVYSGETTPQTIADISSGGLYVFFRAFRDDATTNWLVQSISFARLRYVDV